MRVVVAPADRPPFEADAVAAEEDTYLVLSAPVDVRPPADHPVRLLTALHGLAPEPPGSVVVREGRPLRLLAVVHDLAREPTWREEWVARALEALLAEAGRRRIRRLALPLLGTRHGRLPPERFLSLLGGALEASAPATLEQVWLVAGGEVDLSRLVHRDSR